MLRNCQNSVQAFSRQLNTLTRAYATKKTKTKASTTKEVSVEENINTVHEPLHPAFLIRTLGSNYSRWYNILEKHPELKSLKRKDVENTATTLKALNFALDDILAKPMILYNNALTLENRHIVLKECGFSAITITLLFKYVTIMNKSVTMLKMHGYLPLALNVREQLRSCFKDLELHIPSDYAYSEELELKLLRQQILNYYLRQRFDMNDDDIAKLWKVYGRIRHRSYKSVQDMVHLLLNELQFSKERIIKNAYLLYGDAINVRRIITEIPTINGQDVREIVYRRPKILMSSCDSLLKTLKHVKSFGIGEDAVMRCLEVLTLGPDTVLERLRDLGQIEEFKVLGTNPRVLRLVHYQNKARLRLEYLNQLKVRCASLHILSCDSEAFARFAREGSDRTKGRDIVVFLANTMGKDEQDLRTLLSRHPNWCHIPALHVKQCYDYLLSKHFLNEDIYKNIHLLLYPIKRIEEKINLLQKNEFLEEMQLTTNAFEFNNNELLALTLYLIECEFHFTGDGIWTEQHTQHVENFNNLLPDFPESLNKVYKYGTKPANRSSSTTRTALQNL